MGSCRRRKSSSSSSSWSDLYPEIISSIFPYLETRFDILSFRGVCKQWRKHSVLPPPNLLSPLLPYRVHTSSDTLPPLHIFGRYFSDQQVDLLVKSIYLITPIVVDNIESEASSPTSLSSSWMVMATELEPRKIQLRHPLTGGEIEHLPETLDLTQFRVSELAQGYELQYPYSSNRVRKVALFSSSVSPALSDCTAMVLNCFGDLGVLRLSESIHPRWSESTCRDNIPRQNFDDFVSFKGIHVAVNRHGRLFSLEYEAEDSKPLVVTGLLAADDICNHIGWRKRLVVDPLSDKLYLVEVEYLSKVRFKVYQFNEECNKWDKVEALCHHRALFVGVSHCFFARIAPAHGFSGCPVNCIIFVTDSFPPYPVGRALYGNLSKQKAKERIGVYHLGRRQNKFSCISDYPELLQMMEPPPACFSSSAWVSSKGEEVKSDSNCRDDPSPSNEDERVQSDSNGGHEGEEVQSNSSSEDEGHERLSSPSLVRSESQKQTDERPFTSAAILNNVEHVAGEETPREEIIHTVTVGSNKSNTSTVKFEGLDIRSDLIPTLQKIWLKHGNIIRNSSMRNGNTIASALELLVNVVVTLESNSARSLTDSLVNHLTSALSDLECMRLQVDWLVPMVEKAVALFKSKSLVDSLNKLSQSKVEVAERRSKLIEKLSETDNYEKELDDDIARMSKMIPFSSREVDFDQTLGGGLT